MRARGIGNFRENLKYNRIFMLKFRLKLNFFRKIFGGLKIYSYFCNVKRKKEY